MNDLPSNVLEWALGSATAALGGQLSDPQIRWMGRSSTDMHALDLTDASGQKHELVIRRYVDTQRLANDSWYDADHEARVLRLLEASTVPAPLLLAADTTPGSCDVPTLLTTRILGTPPGLPPSDLPGFLRQLAEPLAAIHRIAIADLPEYSPYYTVDEMRPPDGSTDPAMWERVFDAIANQPPPDTPITFIHRDYHHGQTLWSDGRLTGIVDWSTGCMGPPGIDHARARQNLAWDISVEAADDFLLACHETGAAGHHPYWDLLDAADSLPDLFVTGESLVRFESYVRGLLRNLL